MKYGPGLGRRCCLRSPRPPSRRASFAEPSLRPAACSAHMHACAHQVSRVDGGGRPHPRPHPCPHPRPCPHPCPRPRPPLCLRPERAPVSLGVAALRRRIRCSFMGSPVSSSSAPLGSSGSVSASLSNGASAQSGVEPRAHVPQSAPRCCARAYWAGPAAARFGLNGSNALILRWLRRRPIARWSRGGARVGAGAGPMLA